MPSFREYQLVRRPVGLPAADDLRIVERPVPQLADGDVLVRNLFLSVDPYMRGRMSDAKSYAAPYDLNAPLSGGAVGRVEESRSAAFPVGTVVVSANGWRDGFVSPAKGLAPIGPADGPPQAHLGTLGMPGLTAYVGLLEIGRLAAGETVLVTGAAGAVGSVACQIAKARGCRVIGTAGTDEKTAWLSSQAGVDVAINYRTAGGLRKAFAAAAPDGIDLTFENVGGDHLEAALSAAKTFGRVSICGLISQYNATEVGTGLRNVRDILTKRLTVRGFIVSDHMASREPFLAEMRTMIAAGTLRSTETIIDGFERMPEAFLGLFSGANLGKMVVRVSA